MEITHVSIDLAKSVFQLVAFNRANKVIFNRKVSRAKLIDEVRQLPPGSFAQQNNWYKTSSRHRVLKGMKQRSIHPDTQPAVRTRRFKSRVGVEAVRVGSHPGAGPKKVPQFKTPPKK